MKNHIGSALVLNADYGFLSINQWSDAVGLVFRGKATPLATYDTPIRSANTSFPAPAVLQLRHQVRMGRRRQGFTLPSHRNIWVQIGRASCRERV
jgi:hypothetical protein